MSTPKKFHFNINTSEEDWKLLQKLMERDGRQISEPSYFTNQITDFCKRVAIPLLDKAPCCPSKVSIEFRTPIIHFPEHDRTNLEVLGAFARYKNISITQVIQRYLIENRVMQEELKIIK